MNKALISGITGRDGVCLDLFYDVHGDPNTAQYTREWKPRTSLKRSMAEVTRGDLKAAERIRLIKKHEFFTAFNSHA